MDLQQSFFVYLATFFEFIHKLFVFIIIILLITYQGEQQALPPPPIRHQHYNGEPVEDEEEGDVLEWGEIFAAPGPLQEQGEPGQGFVGDRGGNRIPGTDWEERLVNIHLHARQLQQMMALLLQEQIRQRRDWEEITTLQQQLQRTEQEVIRQEEERERQQEQMQRIEQEVMRQREKQIAIQQQLQQRLQRTEQELIRQEEQSERQQEQMQRFEEELMRQKEQQVATQQQLQLAEQEKSRQTEQLETLEEQITKLSNQMKSKDLRLTVLERREMEKLQNVRYPSNGLATRSNSGHQAEQPHFAPPISGQGSSEAEGAHPPLSFMLEKNAVGRGLDEDDTHTTDADLAPFQPPNNAPTNKVCTTKNPKQDDRLKGKEEERGVLGLEPEEVEKSNEVF